MSDKLPNVLSIIVSDKDKGYINDFNCIILNPVAYISLFFLSLLLAACSSQLPGTPVSDVSEIVLNKNEPYWANEFEESNWQDLWQIKNSILFGADNYVVQSDPYGVFGSVLQVRYPQGSFSPSGTRKLGREIGGLGFYAQASIVPADLLHLRYYVYFAEPFDFVKGGKLPGLCGGKCNSGGNQPNGKDGFSMRLMWRSNGDGEVYAYIPRWFVSYGTSIGRANWRFTTNRWYVIELRVELNTPDKDDGAVYLWVDDELVVEQQKLHYRDTDKLKIDAIMFSTFFGGGDDSWATDETVYTYFDHFAVSTGYIGRALSDETSRMINKP